MNRKSVVSYLILLFVFFIFSDIFGQITVQKVSPESTIANKQGVFYALPLTVIKVDVVVKKTEFYSGPYADYANKYLDLEGVITSDYNEYFIEDIKMGSLAVPDPDNYYFAEIDEKLVKEDKAIILSLTQSGLIVGLNGSVTDEEFNEFRDKSISSSGEEYDLFSYFAETNLYETFDTIIKRVVVDTVTVEKVYLDQKWVEKTDEQKAVEAANMVSKIRESRVNLLTGYQEVAYEGTSLIYMDQELKKLEKEYLSLFTGISIEKKLTYSFTVIPDPVEQPVRIPVFVFSDRTGVKDINASGGERIYVTIERTGDMDTLNSLNNSREGTEKSEHGFYYRIPLSARITLQIDNDLKLEKLIPISQYGTVTYLPSMISSVQFHPKTGGVSKIVIE